MIKNKKLVKLIDKYGRRQFQIDSGFSKCMVDYVYTGRRQFGLRPYGKEATAAEHAASILNVDKAIVRPDIWG